VLLKSLLHHIRYIVIWTPEILQMDLDISPELVIFREYGNDRDLKIVVLNTVMSVHNDAPFWSGHMSAKNLRSSPGRWLSIGMQYLKISPSVVVIVNT